MISEQVLLTLIIVNVAVFILMVCNFYECNKNAKRWRDHAVNVETKFLHFSEWLANNCSEYGDFGKGDDPNIIQFRKKR